MCCGNKVKTGTAVSAALTEPLKPAPDAIIEERRTICRSCEFALPCPNNPPKKCVCDKARRSLAIFTQMTVFACPIGKWAAVTADGKPVSS